MKNYLADLHRPGYALLPPGEYAVPGDPNGAFFADGVYHRSCSLWGTACPGFRSTDGSGSLGNGQNNNKPVNIFCSCGFTPQEHFCTCFADLNPKHFKSLRI